MDRHDKPSGVGSQTGSLKKATGRTDAAAKPRAFALLRGAKECPLNSGPDTASDHAYGVS